tara:strand:+ start:59 stop:367 length:309 start_codon:yes stop_codon:yes gene_type:complete
MNLCDFNSKKFPIFIGSENDFKNKRVNLIKDAMFYYSPDDFILVNINEQDKYIILIVQKTEKYTLINGRFNTLYYPVNKYLILKHNDKIYRHLYNNPIAIEY